MTQTLEQRRAAHAWAVVERVDKELGAEAKKKFGAPAKKLGPRILTAGLGPAEQFLVAKNEGPKLIETLGNWLLEEGPTRMVQRSPPQHVSGAGRVLVEDIIHGDSDRLRWLTAEALAYLAWLTRFCEARGWTEDAA
jgi:CRISPR type III-B/RAMP module-associated protein Cmr5